MSPVPNEVTDIDRIERELSLLLFAAIKPFCIDLSQLALLPPSVFNTDSPKLATCLSNITTTLDGHRASNPGPYALSQKLADYVFFPVSNLLKHPKLSDPVTGHILHVIGFLTEHSWGKTADINLIDQLYPLLVFLVSQNGETSVVSAKALSFKRSAASALTSLLSILPLDYFSTGSIGKRLSLLGDSTNILLDLLAGLLKSPSQDENSLVSLILASLELLYSTRVTPEQTSYVFPGVVSKVVNFCSVSRVLHYTVLIRVIELLKLMIIRVFGDLNLQVGVDIDSKSPTSWEHLNELWEKTDNVETMVSAGQFKLDIKIAASEDKHRTKSWLLATSKQLKLSLVVFFKSLLSAKNRLKLQTKPQLFNAIVGFTSQIVNNCFYSLFGEFLSLSFDILALSIAAVVSEDSNAKRENDLIEECVQTLIEQHSDEKLRLLYEQMELKLSDLVGKFSQVLFSTEDDKIQTFLISVKFHLKLFETVVSRLHIDHFNVDKITGRLFQTIKKELVNSYIFNSLRKKANNKELLAILGRSETAEIPHDFTPGNQEAAPENKLDDIELPAYINAKQIAKTGPSPNKLANRADYSSGLLTLAKHWTDRNGSDSEPTPGHFTKVYSPATETKIQEMIQYLSSFERNSQGYIGLVERLLISEETEHHEASDILERSVSLWMANNMLSSKNAKAQSTSAIQAKDFDINEFLVLEDEDEPLEIPHDDSVEEASYLVLSKSQELLDELSEKMKEPETVSRTTVLDSFRVYEMAYAIALDSIGVLTSHLSIEDFRSDVIMDRLYPLLEALTFQANPSIQQHSAAVLDTIAAHYYNGLLEKLILDNLDYLVDSIGVKLSTSSALAPAILGILLIIMKISGDKLLLSNQLRDILTQMFILIDSYHGYSILVEGFFIVFEVIIEKARETYMAQEKKAIMDAEGNNSQFKPWGMANISQVLQLLERESQMDEFVEYDSKQEYFKRNPGVPFGEQVGDSDDEDEEEEPSEPQEKKVWTSSIPEPIYFQIQQIFSYGFRLLSHPSTSLKVQVLKTLRKAHPLLETDYSLFAPLVTQNWAILLTLIAGSKDTDVSGENAHYIHPETENLMIPALELVVEILKGDERQKEPFFGRKFLDLWEFLLKNSAVFCHLKETKKRDTKMVVSRSTYNRKLLELCGDFVVSGLNNYGRIIPDLVQYEMAKGVYYFGVGNRSLNREVRNLLWLIENGK